MLPITYFLLMLILEIHDVSQTLVARVVKPLYHLSHKCRSWCCLCLQTSKAQESVRINDTTNAALTH